MRAIPYINHNVAAYRIFCMVAVHIIQRQTLLCIRVDCGKTICGRVHSMFD